MAFSGLSVLLLGACLATAALSAESFAEPRVASVSYAGPGYSCAHRPCAYGLLCEKYACKIKAGRSCLGNEAHCVAGTVCAGTKHKKTCVKPMTVGGQCGRDPFWVCASGLKCVKHKCVDPAGPGGKCGATPFDICEAGLVCQNYICKTPKGGSCLPSGSVCAHGTVCAGTSKKKTCVVPMGPGGQCGVDPFWVCASGLVCQNYTCKTPKGGNCSVSGAVCVSGTVCAGKPGSQICVTAVPEGGACDGKYAVCESYLTCRYGKCRDGRAELGGRCGSGRECVEGLVCRSGGPGGIRKTCLRLVGAGEKCEIGSEVQCKDGLVCKHGWCAY